MKKKVVKLSDMLLVLGAYAKQIDKEYYSVNIEACNRYEGKVVERVTVYVDGFKHFDGATFEEALNLFLAEAGFVKYSRVDYAIG